MSETLTTPPHKKKLTRTVSWKDIGNVGVMVGRVTRPSLSVRDSLIRLFINSDEEPRLVPRKRGRINVRSTNVPSIIEYVFFVILDLPWLHYILFVSVLCVIVFGIFGSLFWITGGGFSYHHLEEELSIWSCIFFTFQTFENIGYGLLSPDTMSGDLVVTIISLLSNFMKIFCGGILIHKLNDPKKLKYTNKFSDVAVWNNNTLSYQGDRYNTGVDCLSFRVARTCSRSKLCDSKFHLVYFKTRPGMDGYERFELQELDFEINKQLGRSRYVSLSLPLFELPWTIIHPIDTNSPLYGLTLRDMENENGEVIGIIGGTDEISKNRFQTRWSYKASNILKDHEFVSCVKREDDGYFYVNLSRLSKTREVDPERRHPARKSPMRMIARAVKKGYMRTGKSIRKIGGVIMRMDSYGWSPKSASGEHLSQPVQKYGRSHSLPLPSNPSSEDLPNSDFLRNLLRDIMRELPTSLSSTTPEKNLTKTEQIYLFPSNATTITELSSNVKLDSNRVRRVSAGKLERRRSSSNNLGDSCCSEQGAGRFLGPENYWSEENRLCLNRIESLINRG